VPLAAIEDPAAHPHSAIRAVAGLSPHSADSCVAAAAKSDVEVEVVRVLSHAKGLAAEVSLLVLRL
jgi:hypothetical protein